MLTKRKISTYGLIIGICVLPGFLFMGGGLGAKPLYANMKFLLGKIFKPSRLDKKDIDHGYEFYSAYFQKQNSKTTEEPKTSMVIYFRNVAHQIFGKIDYSKFATSQDIRSVASKIIKNKEFRENFIISNPKDKIFFGKWR